MTATTPSEFFAAAFETLVAAARAARARRARHLALATLIEMDAHRLDDLGLNVGDIVEALEAPAGAVPLLEARRARRAAAWGIEPAPAH
jgi:uncharacterized protein YjiS (DUF1127 family)